MSLETSCKDYIDALFVGITGYVSYADGEKEAAIEDNVYYTYGEILYESIDELIQYVKVTKDDVVCDLGSGVGKVGTQFFLKSPTKKVIGFEAHVARFASSEYALKQLQGDLPELFSGERSMSFTQGNFLELDWSEATIMFTCSTCFGPELLEAISKIVDKNTNLRYVMSLKPLTCTRLELIEKRPINCTWDKSHCYIYGNLPKSRSS